MQNTTSTPFASILVRDIASGNDPRVASSLCAASPEEVEAFRVATGQRDDGRDTVRASCLQELFHHALAVAGPACDLPFETCSPLEGEARTFRGAKALLGRIAASASYVFARDLKPSTARGWAGLRVDAARVARTIFALGVRHGVDVYRSQEFSDLVPEGSSKPPRIRPRMASALGIALRDLARTFGPGERAARALGEARRIESSILPHCPPSTQTLDDGLLGLAREGDELLDEEDAADAADRIAQAIVVDGLSEREAIRKEEAGLLFPPSLEIAAGLFAEEVQDLEGADEWLRRHALDPCDVLSVAPSGSVDVEGGGTIEGTPETYQATQAALDEASDPLRSTLLAAVREAHAAASGSWTSRDWDTPATERALEELRSGEGSGEAARRAADEADAVEASARAAEGYAEDAVDSAEKGDWDDAEAAAREACAQESRWGDDPTWRPFLRVVMAARLIAQAQAALEDEDADRADDLRDELLGRRGETAQPLAKAQGAWSGLAEAWARVDSALEEALGAEEEPEAEAPAVDCCGECETCEEREACEVAWDELFGAGDEQVDVWTVTRREGGDEQIMIRGTRSEALRAGSLEWPEGGLVTQLAPH